MCRSTLNLNKDMLHLTDTECLSTIHTMHIQLACAMMFAKYYVEEHHAPEGPSEKHHNVCRESSQLAERKFARDTFIIMRIVTIWYIITYKYHMPTAWCIPCCTSCCNSTRTRCLICLDNNPALIALSVCSTILGGVFLRLLAARTTSCISWWEFLSIFDRVNPEQKAVSGQIGL